MSIKIENIGPLINKIIQEKDIQNIPDAQEAIKDMFENNGFFLPEEEK
jgi:hypothetical protein